MDRLNAASVFRRGMIATNSFRESPVVIYASKLFVSPLPTFYLRGSRMSSETDAIDCHEKRKSQV
jgi:hypothetical protein